MMSKDHITTCCKAGPYDQKTTSTTSNDEDIQLVLSTSKPPRKKLKECTDSATKSGYKQSIDLPMQSPEQYKDIMKTSFEMHRGSNNKVKLVDEKSNQFSNLDKTYRYDGGELYEPKDRKRRKAFKNEEDLKENTTEAEKVGIDDFIKAHETKKKKNLSSYEFLGEESNKDEAEVLEVLNLHWLENIARKERSNSNNAYREQHKGFYNKYCNGTNELCVETAARLMSLPHVVKVILKPTIPKIEVIVSDIYLAIKDSPELRGDYFEVTEVDMGIHLFEN